MIEDDDVTQVDVYIQPPEQGPGDDTDADSGEEDCNNPNRLSRRQLQAPAELVVNKGNDDDREDVDYRTSFYRTG